MVRRLVRGGRRQHYPNESVMTHDHPSQRWASLTESNDSTCCATPGHGTEASSSRRRHFDEAWRGWRSGDSSGCCIRMIYCLAIFHVSWSSAHARAKRRETLTNEHAGGGVPRFPPSCGKLVSSERSLQYEWRAANLNVREKQSTEKIRVH